VSHFNRSPQISLEQCILGKNVSDKSFETLREISDGAIDLTTLGGVVKVKARLL